MKHELLLEQRDRETWVATCSCGQWQSRFTLDDVPIDQTGDLKTIATAELEQRYRKHIAGA